MNKTRLTFRSITVAAALVLLAGCASTGNNARPSPSPSKTAPASELSVHAFGVGTVSNAYFAVDSAENVYLPGGTDGAALIKMSPAGKVVARWRGLEVVPGQPDTIVGIAIDPASHDVWATDTTANRVVRLSPDLVVKTSWGSAGRGKGQFFGPGGIAITKDGRLVVADLGNNRVQVFTPQGVVKAVWDSPGGMTVPADVAAAPNGDVYVSTTQPLTNDRAGEIVRVNSAGKVVQTYTSVSGSTLYFPDAAVSSNGELLVADAVMGLLTLNSAGLQVNTWAIPGAGTAPTSVRVAPSGSVYAMACNLRVGPCELTKFTPAGSAAKSWFITSPVTKAGTKIKVDSFGLYLQCVGTGSPTIVWSSGGGSSGWADTSQYLMGQLGKVSRFCVYDRRGMGFSDPNPDDDFLHWSTKVSDLHGVLHTAKVPGPYVLAGYSLGGLIARLYAYKYPSEVVGLLAIDPSTEDIFSQPAVEPDAPLGITRCADSSCPVFADIQAVHATTHNKIAGSLGSLPLVVIGHNPAQQYMGADFDKYWLKLGREVAKASTNSMHVTAGWSSHSIPDSEPALVVETVRELVTAAQASQHTLPACGKAITTLGALCN